MPVDSGTINDVLFLRGPVSAPGIAAQLGGGIESVDVSAEMMDLMLRGLVEEVRAQPPRWKLTEAGIQLGWDRKGKSFGIASQYAGLGLTAAGSVRLRASPQQPDRQQDLGAESSRGIHSNSLHGE
jgi:hypothetical protein